MNLINEVQIDRVMNAVVAGTTSQNGSVSDMQGYDGIMYVVAFGAITATGVQGLKAQQGAQSNLSDGADLEGSLVSVADTGSNKCAVLDIYRPQERYLRPVVTRGTANAVIDSVIAIKYNSKSKPTVQAAAVAASKLIVSPAEGTA